MALVMDGDVRPGDPLSIDALARELGVSSTPLREALARLESTGLVRRYAMKGYRVAPVLTPEELAELVDVRLALEPVAVRRAVASPSPELQRRLRDAVARLEAAPRGDHFETFRDYLEADEAFHREIFAHAGNRFLTRAYESLGSQVQRFRLFSGEGVTDAEPTIHEHAAILAAIEAGDEDGAVAAMVRHLEGVRSRAIVDTERQHRD